MSPYVLFCYGKEEMITKSAANSGHNAKWDQSFELRNVRQKILNGEELVFETYDEDASLHEFLGASRPINW
jgi:hypothetical protein